jgi:hypothetical protein
MKIEGNLFNRVRVQCVPIGEVFVYCDKIYMRVDTQPLAWSTPASCLPILHIETGVIYTIYEDALVSSRNAKLVLE